MSSTIYGLTSEQKLPNAALTDLRGMFAALDDKGRQPVRKGDMVIDARDYGATGDGFPEDQAIQATLNAAADAAAFGVAAWFPAGVYAFTGALTFPDGVRVLGAGMHKTTFKSADGSAPAAMVRVNSNVTAEGWTLDGNNRPDSIGVIVEAQQGDSIAFRSVRVRNTAKDLFRAPYQVRDFTVTECVFEDADYGVSILAPTLGKFSHGITFSLNRWRRVGGNNLQLFGGADPAVIPFEGVKFIGNDLREFRQVGPHGPIPMEPTGVRDLVLTGNTIVGPSTRGVSFGNCVGVTGTANTITDQSFYAFELNGGKRYTLVGNTVARCRQIAAQTGGGLEDVLIEGNTYHGSGLTAAESFDVMRFYDAKRVDVRGNTFVDWQHLRSCVRVGESATPAQDVTVEGNHFHIFAPETPLNVVMVRRGVRTSVARNKIKVHRPLTAGDSNSGPVLLWMDAGQDDIVVDDNEITFLADISAASDHAGIRATYTAAGPIPRLLVKRNRIVGGLRGINLGSVTSVDARVEDNDTRGCLSPDTLPAGAVVRVTREVDATSAPTTGAWRRGDRVNNLTPSSGAPVGWVCVATGAPGSWAPYGVIG